MEKVRVGTIVRGFGIKGEVKVKIHSDEPEKRFKVKRVLLLGESLLPLTIRSVRYHQGHVLLSFNDYPDLTSVEAFVGENLWVEVSEKDEGLYFYRLIGIDVLNDKYEHVGQVIDVFQGVQYPIFRIQLKDRVVLVPYIEQFVKSVDLEQKQVIVEWMEGL